MGTLGALYESHLRLSGRAGLILSKISVDPLYKEVAFEFCPALRSEEVGRGTPSTE